MNSAKNKIIERLSDPIEKGIQVIGTQYRGGAGWTYVDAGKFVAYRSQAEACVIDIVGENHSYAKSLHMLALKTGHLADANAIKGIIESLKEDVEKGHLQTFREIVHSEIFTDFIEMAQHLLDQGYKDPAAVIIGSVLEEHLRKLCDKNGLSTTSADKNGARKPMKASQLNDDLYKAHVYLGTNQKQITAWLALRNEAAHGHFSSYQDSEIKTMISGVTGFLAQHPA